MESSGMFVDGSYQRAVKNLRSAIKGPNVKCCNDFNNCNDEDIDKTKVNEAVKVVDAVIRRDGDFEAANDDQTTLPSKIVKSKNAAVSAAVGELTLVKVLVLSLSGLMMKLHWSFVVGCMETGWGSGR